MSDQPTTAMLAPAEVSLSTTLERMARDPAVDVTKLERLIAIARDVRADEARAAFDDAMARVQAQMPQIRKGGSIAFNGKEQNRYAKLEDIDEVIRPIYTREGFSVDFDSTTLDGQLVHYTCEVARAGHKKTRTIDLPMDKSGSKNPTQGAGSTNSYARRYLLTMVFNLVTRDEDNDGNGDHVPAEYVTEAQAVEMARALTAANGDVDAFLRYFRIERFDEMLSGNYRRAMGMIAQKAGAR